jgi:hypothetical protein
LKAVERAATAALDELNGLISGAEDESADGSSGMTLARRAEHS